MPALREGRSDRRAGVAILEMKIVSIDGKETEVELDGSVEVVAVREDEIELRVGDRLHVVPYVIQGSTVHFAFEGETYVAEVTERGARAKARHRDHSTEAPMPGAVLKILVKQGDVVAKGTPLLILEAMKMEHQIVAGHEGKVVSVNCKEGELVQPGVELVTLE